MQNGSIDLHADPARFNELKARLTTMNTEPGVHSTLYLDQLFSGSFAGSSATHSPIPPPSGGGTPSPTPTPSIYYPSASVNHSSMTLEKHQLSPIMEKKVVSIGDLSGDNSAETLNQLTVTTVVEVDPHNHQRLQDIFNKLDADELVAEEDTPTSNNTKLTKEDEEAAASEVGKQQNGQAISEEQQKHHHESEVISLVSCASSTTTGVYEDAQEEQQHANSDNADRTLTSRSVMATNANHKTGDSPSKSK